MQRIENEIKLKPFKNYYCNSVACALGRYINIFEYEEDLLKDLTLEDIEKLIELAVVKNKLAGVGELFLKVPYVGLGVKYLNKYNIKGKEILSASQMFSLKTSEMIGDRFMFDIENLLDYSEGYLTELADLSGKLGVSVMISLGRDIEEVGKLVNRYNMSPVEIIESFGFLDRKCYVYGLNYIDKDDQKLLSNYNANLIFMPKNDGEEGRGAINLFNFIYNGLKFGFSSEKCYNIDMLAEAKLALTNTTNLMHQQGLVEIKTLLSSLEMENKNEEISIPFDEEEVEANLLDKKVVIQDEMLIERLKNLEEEIKQIAKKLKEKKQWN